MTIHVRDLELRNIRVFFVMSVVYTFFALRRLLSFSPAFHVHSYPENVSKGTLSFPCMSWLSLFVFLAFIPVLID